MQVLMSIQYGTYHREMVVMEHQHRMRNILLIVNSLLSKCPNLLSDYTMSGQAMEVGKSPSIPINF